MSSIAWELELRWPVTQIGKFAAKRSTEQKPWKRRRN